jgi:nucleoid-associated protein YgaU
MTITASSPIRPARRRSAPAGEPAPTGEPAPPPLRLTRRGRIVVVLALALLTLAVLSAGRQALSAATGNDRPATVQVTVRPGDTLWSIADRITPRGQDVRITVAQIRALNGLHDGTVRAGSRLRLPHR